MAKKSIGKQPWVMPTAAGVVGLGLGYWFGKKQATAPGGKALPAGQVYVSAPGQYQFSLRGLPQTQPSLPADEEAVLGRFFQAIYPASSWSYGKACQDWLATPINERLRLIDGAASYHNLTKGGYTSSQISGWISWMCSGEEAPLATPVAPKVTVFQSGSVQAVASSFFTLMYPASQWQAAQACKDWSSTPTATKYSSLLAVANYHKMNLGGYTAAQVIDAMTALCRQPATTAPPTVTPKTYTVPVVTPGTSGRQWNPTYSLVDPMPATADPSTLINPAIRDFYMSLLAKHGYTCTWWNRVADVSRQAALEYITRMPEASTVFPPALQYLRGAITLRCRSM